MTTAGVARSPAARQGARREPWLDVMVLPTLGVLGLVVGYPIIYTFALSTQKYNLLEIEPARFVGLDNYRELVADGAFWDALANTAIYTFGSVGCSVVLGLTLALLTENLGGFRYRLVRALLLTPWAVPFVVVAFLFRYMYLLNGGAINAVLLETGLISSPVPWLNTASLAMPAVMVANIWATTPFFFLLFGAALAGIPNEVIESARVDRARTWSMIVHIKLPFLRNALLIGSLLMVIANFNDFAKIWAMTQG
jgi:multiple sugar transport system permease protein